MDSRYWDWMSVLFFATLVFVVPAFAVFAGSRIAINGGFVSAYALSTSMAVMFAVFFLLARAARYVASKKVDDLRF